MQLAQLCCYPTLPLSEMVSHCLQPFSAPCGQADNCSMPWGLPVLHLGAASNPCSSRISCGEVVGIPPGVREPPCLSLCMLQGGGKCSFSFSQACSCKAEAELSDSPSTAPPSSPVPTGCSGAGDGTGGGPWSSPWQGAEAGHPGTLRVLRDPPNPPCAPCLFAEAPWLHTEAAVAAKDAVSTPLCWRHVC